jgi:hypothetical protein
VHLWCNAPAATPSAGFLPSRGRPARIPPPKRGAPAGSLASVLAWGGPCAPLPRFARCRDETPPAPSARVACLFPGQFRPGPRLALCARCPPDRACDRRPARRHDGAGLGRRPEGRGASRGASAGSGGTWPGPCPPAAARQIHRTHPGPPFRAGPPRRGTGRRRMVHCLPRRRLVPAPATFLRRGPALPRRGAEFPLP